MKLQEFKEKLDFYIEKYGNNVAVTIDDETICDFFEKVDCFGERYLNVSLPYKTNQISKTDFNFLREFGKTINCNADKDNGDKYIAIIQKGKPLVGLPDFADFWGLCLEGEEVAEGLDEAKEYLINYILDGTSHTDHENWKVKNINLILKIREIEDNEALSVFLRDEEDLNNFSFLPLQQTWEAPSRGLKITFDIEEAKKYIADKPNLKYELIRMDGSNSQMQKLFEILSKIGSRK
ncbi:hypothetical protein [Campylobacter sp. RM16188]|uniref:hypothetical protein n=1 Tax=Campylobacter sp. RM16188 TaxID=1705725 RepID=UPI001551D353|nr:hypothetical protein [Campylobacter sp. RM16188]